jgi:hypothetical protein
MDGKSVWPAKRMTSDDAVLPADQRQTVSTVSFASRCLMATTRADQGQFDRLVRLDEVEDTMRPEFGLLASFLSPA